MMQNRVAHRGITMTMSSFLDCRNERTNDAIGLDEL
jgi:hypothetical protein